MKYGYIRVSTKTQDENRQIQVLLNMGVSIENIFCDKASGKNFVGREQWDKLMANAVIGDIIVIKELDRLGRNNREIQSAFDLIRKKGVFLEFVEQPLLNTANKTQIEAELIQPLILHLLGYFVEKEAEKIRQRQREAYETLEKDNKGRKISRKKNKILGRPSKIENLSRDQERVISDWKSKKLKLRDCVKLTGLSKSTLYRIINMNE